MSDETHGGDARPDEEPLLGTSSRRAEERRSPVLPVTAVVVAGALALGGVVGLVNLMPRQAHDDRKSALQPATSPAAKAIDAAINVVPAHGPISTRPVGQVGASVCEIPKDASAPPVLTRSTSTGDATATLTVYRAGTAAQAFAAQRSMLQNCTGVQWTNGPEAGQESLNITLNGSNATVWRRGSIIGSVVTGGSDPAGVVRTVDGKLGASMSECISQDETVDDAVRTPLAKGGVHFTGLLRQRTATMTKSLADQMTPPQPLPGGDLPDVTLPNRPADPVWPDQLPAPVQRPTVPVQPQVPELSQSTQQRIADPDGPGCGWAFAGEEAPAFNADQAKVDADKRIAAMTAQLDQKGRAYVSAKAAYDSSLAAYGKAAESYRKYADEVSKVASAWGAIQAARDQYDKDLAAYNAAVGAYNKFMQDQSKANSDFATAQAACATVTPTPSVVTPPPETVTIPGTVPPVPPGSPEPTPPPTPTPTVTTIPGTPTTTMALPSGCPPDRPAILDQQPPQVPPSPTPPPDPRPTR